MLPSVEIRQYVDAAGVSPFDQWFGRLNDVAAARVTTSLARLSAGNWSNVKGVGGGVLRSRSISALATECIWARTETGRHPARRWYEEAPEPRHRDRQGPLEAVQAAQDVGARRCH